MNWAKKYSGVPFAEKGRAMDGSDCWGLVCLIYKNERGIILPDYLDVYESTDDREILSKTINDERNEKWLNPDTPQEFDIIVLKMLGLPMHVGVVIDRNHMIHCSQGIGTAIERFDAMRWKNKVMGFARWAI